MHRARDIAHVDDDMPYLPDAERHALGARQPLDLFNIAHVRLPWRTPRSIGRSRRNSAILRRLCNLAPPAIGLATAPPITHPMNAAMI
jgi:hypothetical protein